PRFHGSRTQRSPNSVARRDARLPSQQLERPAVPLDPLQVLRGGVRDPAEVQVVLEVRALDDAGDRVLGRPPTEVEVVLALPSREGVDGGEDLLVEALGPEL